MFDESEFRALRAAVIWKLTQYEKSAKWAREIERMSEVRELRALALKISRLIGENSY